MMEKMPVGVGWPGVPVETGALANGLPSANSVARCLSIETMMCSGPDGMVAVRSAAFFSPVVSVAFFDFFFGSARSVSAAGVVLRKELSRKKGCQKSFRALAG